MTRCATSATYEVLVLDHGLRSEALTSNGHVHGANSNFESHFQRMAECGSLQELGRHDQTYHARAVIATFVSEVLMNIHGE